MRINNNIMALNTHRQYAVNNNSVSKSTERLSSGSKINRAGDDAAGLAISEKMRAQIRGLNMASKNSSDAISLVQTAEGALTETHSILQRMNELAVQSASDTNEDDVDRDALQDEFDALRSEIDDIARKTTFNNKNLLDGTFGSTSSIAAASAVKVEGAGAGAVTGLVSVSFKGFSAGAGQTIVFADNAGNPYSATYDGVTVTADNTDEARTMTLDFGGGRIATFEFSDAVSEDALVDSTLTFDVSNQAAKIQTGANAGETLDISISAMTSAALGLTGLNISTRGEAAVGATPATGATLAITSLQSAINTVSTQRSKLGAIQNRLEHKINNLDTSAENLQAAESRIRDIDMAKQMTEFTTQNILVQAATAMLAQANSAPQNVLSLLK